MDPVIELNHIVSELNEARISMDRLRDFWEDGKEERLWERAKDASYAIMHSMSCSGDVYAEYKSRKGEENVEV